MAVIVIPMPFIIVVYVKAIFAVGAFAVSAIFVIIRTFFIGMTMRIVDRLLVSTMVLGSARVLFRKYRNSS